MNTHEVIRAYMALRDEYDAYAAESRACGYDVPTFEVWSGATDPKAEAQDRIADLIDRDVWDLY